MIHLPLKNRCTPIGVDLGTRSVKLVQFNADGSQLIDAARWDLPPCGADTPAQNTAVTQALQQARSNRKFRGRDAVICLGRGELFLQNIRVPKASGAELERLVQQDAAGRVPHALAETEIRYIEAADVRQGDALLREVILFACHRPVLQTLLSTVEAAGLNPVAVDVESNAIVRMYRHQFRRDDDRRQRGMLVHIGFSGTAVVIAQGDDILFVKYIPIGGREMDAAVAAHLEMDLAEATALRRNNGDRRVDQQDPEVAASIGQAIRPVVEKLISELSLCIRYHSVTFRGQPLARLVLGGGEANESLREVFGRRLDLTCQLCDPLRNFANGTRTPRQGQWDVAAGLALRDVEAK